MKYVIVHKGALVRQQGGSGLAVWVFPSREAAEGFASEWLVNYQVVVAGVESREIKRAGFSIA